MSQPPFGFPNFPGLDFHGEYMHAAINQLRSLDILLGGAPGFFMPRMPSPFLHPPGSPEAVSFYDVSALKATLERLVDFELIDAGDAPGAEKLWRKHLESGRIHLSSGAGAPQTTIDLLA